MAHTSSIVSAYSLEEDLGIVYLIDTAQQFWSELEDVLKLPSDEAPTLSLLDSTLRQFLSLSSTYHEQYLQSPLQFEHACTLLLDSELFEFHSERMCEIIVDDAQSSTNPHFQLLAYSILLYYGHRRAELFRSHKRWQPLIPLLMDHVKVEMDPDVEDTYFGTSGDRNAGVNIPVPIEVKLRSLGVKILYEVCRVQKISVQDLRVFDNSFIEYLFELVEQTRYMHDETFNYSVIKLIVALNEQFMVASLGDDSGAPKLPDPVDSKNRILKVLMRRLGSSRTFGENMIFMLNRAKRTSEDSCMQLLILKILYLLFTTKGTSEYFYTNDLCVLVDVFLRELCDLDEESESLRHTYLRVLHPLLTKTQLRDIPYKRPQIVYSLEALVGNSLVREVSPTTKRLVERCLSGDWCVQLKSHRDNVVSVENSRRESSGSDISTAISPLSTSSMTAAQAEASGSGKSKLLKFSKSVENLTAHVEQARQPPRSPVDHLRRPSNGSTFSLPAVANSTVPNASPMQKRRSGSQVEHHANPASTTRPLHDHPYHPVGTSSPLVPRVLDVTDEPSIPIQEPVKNRRPPPPAPPKRRKPPAIPGPRTLGGATITTIRSSATSPLAKVSKVGALH